MSNPNIPAIRRNCATPDLPSLIQETTGNPPPFSATHQNPRYHQRVMVDIIPTGLKTASSQVSEQLRRWHDAHKGKYSSTVLKTLEDLGQQVQELCEARRSGVIRIRSSGDGAKILCILAQLKAMRECMDKVDDMEKDWVWVESSEAKAPPLDTDTDGEYVVVEKNGEEDVNGGKDIGEQGMVAIMQMYLKALTVY
ncbi:hypothetical protein GE21DRAFT_9620 [Neurospora crassa]|uniref:Uncharacterized protein n=1 Tax=Neurospora crassa (strain ATCC 24698 / 74-OR23-1A / CBS 708.71 / DSM 1257 / FGSC 987) TaxID=367110 RepID=Q7RW18_NEUCR|nr:hypothetical protein NCU04992 [Neurospora crassa OR74A]EAA26528.1 hypothetical protein NCU04992 [Neurospora crassa OR74A]KHE78588.1 hypothetical protein GE21DRAFT_9620 [Neurospora crassa]|eukprot:XP_955764.1 hypothetical protein NCU04992 [Neurospora crassa OR74A]